LTAGNHAFALTYAKGLWHSVPTALGWYVSGPGLLRKELTAPRIAARRRIFVLPPRSRGRADHPAQLRGPSRRKTDPCPVGRFSGGAALFL
jgi:hypothetical protein